jgi:hypothetical protein
MSGFHFFSPKAAVLKPAPLRSIPAAENGHSIRASV